MGVKRAKIVLDPRLLEILVCPVSKAPLIYKRSAQELWCKVSKLAYPIRDGIPVMLEDQARQLSDAELDGSTPAPGESEADQMGGASESTANDGDGEQ